MSETNNYQLTIEETDLIIIALDNSKLVNYTCSQVSSVINSLRVQYATQAAAEVKKNVELEKKPDKKPELEIKGSKK